MSTSFATASRHSQYKSLSDPHSTSPPSLTNTSSPTSSDSTGDDEATATRGARTTASNRRAAEAAAAAQSTNSASFNAFSPSIWGGEHSQSLIPGLNANDVESHQHVKLGLEAMNFAGWDGNFANLGGQNDADLSMDMDSTSSTDYGFSPHSIHSPASSHNAMPSFSSASQALTQDSPSGSDSKTGSMPRDPATVASTASFAGSGDDSDGHVAWTGKTSDNDEAMFDSFVQAGSFDSPSIKAEPGVPHANGANGANGHTFASMNIPTSSSAAMMPPSAPNKATGSRKAAASVNASASSSRRNSGESSEPKKMPGSATTATTVSRRTGSQTAVHSNNLDADLGYSAFEVIRPNREGLKDLQVHIHGVPMHGAKSRVETQIRMRIELVRPKTAPAGGWERIGSFTHIKLPPLSGTKRKSKKYQKTDVPPEKTLFVDATVVNATPPHDRVFVCKGCRQRERKRAHRKKDPKTPLESQPTDEEMKSLGIDPSAPDAVEKTQARMEEEEKKRVVLFNCGDFVDFEEGEAVLPTRITCYCRHHKEKVGFCVIFTMRDWQGRLIATGSTPPIMITDDHKSMGIAAQAAQAAAAGAASSASSPSAPASLGVIKQVNGTSPRNPPTQQQTQLADDQAGAATSTSGSATPNGSVSTDAPAKQRKERSKPYDGNRRRRNTSGKDLNMTPYSGTGQNTPSVSATSPAPVGNGGVDFSSNDFWNAFATAGTAMNGLGRSNSTSTGTKTPGDASSVGGSPTPAGLVGTGPSQPVQHSNGLPQSSLQLPQMPPQMQAQLAQGSLSPTTLQTNLASLPNFDLEQFFRNAQAGVSSGVDFAQLMAMAAAAALPPHLRPNSTPTGPVNPAFAQASPPGPNPHVEQAPVPRISKLIPGEGPTSGGIEVTVLGENFTEGITCVFGDVPASNTKVWASNTLVCLLPPSSSPGPVVVSVKGAAQAVQPPPVNGPLQLFTYIDTTDRALMELALQVVGLQMTGQMRSAREVAMRVVGSGAGQQPGMPSAFNGGAGGGVGHAQAREAVAGLFTSRSQSSNFQDTLVQFLSLLDADVSTLDHAQPRVDAIRLANKQGHTLLHLATLMGFHRLVEALISRGCPLDARDRNGVTALHFAAIQGRVTIARMLLRAGARDDVADANGLYAIDLARNHDQVDVETILDNTSRTGHWQTRRLSSHAASSLSYDEDEEDLVSDELSSEASESDVDEDNVSTSFDEYSDDSCSVSGDDADDAPRRSASDVADDIEARQALAELPAPVIDEKASLKATSARLVQEASKPSSDKKGLSKPDAGQDSAVNKSWLSKAGDTGADWMNRAFLPQTVAHKFAQLHMPAMPTMSAISVFQLGLQAPAFMPWSGAQRGEQAGGQGAKIEEIGDSKGKSRSDEAPDHQAWEQDERGRLLTLWKNIVEEGAWSLNPLYSPPPAYESVATAEGQTAASIATQEVASPPAAAAVAPADTTSECSTPVAGPSRRPSTRRRAANAGEGSSAASTSASSHPVKSTAASAGSSGKGKAPAHASSAAVARRRKGQLQLRDDAMLVWFWIPVLLIAAVVLLFSKSSSMFSYADLMSYLDLPAVGRNRDA